jgi:hypothetical protein
MVNRLGDVEVLEAIEKRDVTSYSGLVGFFVGGNVSVSRRCNIC